jgi:hypothetical protein
MPTYKEALIQDAVELFEKVRGPNGIGNENLVKTLEAAYTGEDLQAALSIAHANLVWCASGLHQIRMGHKMLAAMLASTASVDVANYVRAPWPAFHLELPPDFLRLRDEITFSPCNIVELAVTFIADVPIGERKPGDPVVEGKPGDPVADRWQITVHTDTRITWTYRFSTRVLVEQAFAKSGGDALTAMEDPFAAMEDPFTSENLLTLCMVSRLIVNTCLAMSDPTNIRSKPKQVRGVHSGPEYKRNGQATTQTWVLGRERIIDVRDVVREYLETGKVRQGLSVQILVAGHYKIQHYGPKNSQSKVIWIEPYRKGPDDAPMLVSPGVLRN